MARWGAKGLGGEMWWVQGFLVDQDRWSLSCCSLRSLQRSVGRHASCFDQRAIFQCVRVVALWVLSFLVGVMRAVVDIHPSRHRHSGILKFIKARDWDASLPSWSRYVFMNFM